METTYFFCFFTVKQNKSLKINEHFLICRQQAIKFKTFIQDLDGNNFTNILYLKKLVKI